MATEDRRRITDVRALRGLADPVRYRILGHLMAVGPQTASQCAAIVGATPSNCSYHLRELARYGFVERVPAGEGPGDGRERPWRPTATGLTYGPPVGEVGDAVAGDAQRRLLHAGVDSQAQLAHDAIDRHPTWPMDWQQAESVATYGLLVDARELLSLTTTIDALLRPYIGLTRKDAPPDARPVQVALTAFRIPEA